MNRLIALGVAAIALALWAGLISGCGGDDSSGGIAQAGSVQASCDGIRGLSRYRYNIRVKLQSATPAHGNQGTQPTTPAPLSEFALALNSLFADFALDGAHIAPDREQAILRFQADELEFRSIGSRSWIRTAGAWQEEDATTAGDLLTPYGVCQEIVAEIAPSLDKGTSDKQTVNGIDTDHYGLDQNDLGKLLPPLVTSLPEKYVVEAWLAKDGSWPVRLKIASSDMDENGQPVGYNLSMEVRDVNDSGIVIDEPP